MRFAGILKWFLGYRESNWLMFLTRQVMEGAHSFEEAKQWLTSKELVAPIYFVLGGNSPKEVTFGMLFIYKDILL